MKYNKYKKYKNYMKYTYVLAICMGVFMVSGCKADDYQNDEQSEDVSAWIVDWDLDRGIEETDSLYSDLSSLQLFGAYFDESGNLFIKDNLKESSLLEQNPKDIDNLYLTVVNDIVREDGSSIQKDSEIMRDILTNEDKKQAHINELVSLACSHEFVGVELDYEKIDNDIWEKYAKFIDELGKELEKNDKKLRVVLEPRSPIEQVALPEDYEYVMMAYNLYGYHSGPGPKADKEFITNLSQKSKNHLSDVRMAFSLGGFDWTEEENPKALTEAEATRLLEDTKSKLERDANSGAVHFTYIDENSKTHTVWYCDSETIDIWMDTARDNGINKFALWRLGGNI